MTIELDGVNNTLKTDKIEPQSGTALQVGASGDTITLPSGATLTIAGTANVTGTLSNSGTATGFGAIDWQTSDVKTSTFTAVASKGYFVNTTGGAITVNLPAGSAGAQVALIDYAGTWDTNACTIAPNGSEKIEGTTQDVDLNNERESITLIYQDSTQGWIAISNSDGKVSPNPTYISASGGTITTSGDYKIHTFTGDGTFTVSSVGNTAGSNTVDYLVIAGGGGTGGSGTGGGGAGGYRFSDGTASGSYSAGPSPLGASALPVSAQAYPIAVGGGTTGGCGTGGNSVFSTITSTGGGGAATQHSQAGGSGAGQSRPTSDPEAGSIGAGNVPPVSPPQGNPGGASLSASKGGGGGGAGGAGSDATPGTAGVGGVGLASSITASPVTRGGGGGGGAHFSGYNPGPASGGGGAGGTYSSPGAGTNGTANTGGGAGGGGGRSGINGGGPATGGSGLVVIRYKYQN